MRATTGKLSEPLLVVAVFAADRLTKIWAQTQLRPAGSIRVLPFFRLTYLKNTGAAWGMLHERNALLIAISMGLLVALFALRRRWLSRSPWAHIGLVLVAGGALGNLYDRIRFGGVIDFLDFLVWPVFNVADSCITVGACCLAWGLRSEKDDPNVKTP